MKAMQKIIILLWITASGTHLFAQERIVLRGTVKDKETGELIVGANVIEYDQDKRIISGTITDPNGNYILNVTNPDALIMISFIGYEAQEVPLRGRSNLNVELISESYDLEGVTVTATSTADPLTGISERNVTSSRVKIDMAESKHIGAISAEEALQGKVTGLDIISVSGDPGSGSSIVIRGLGSLGNSRPLIVVDGIPQTVAVGSDFDFASADQEDIGDLVNIAPQDIKSIEVLKDAGSTAQWGSKGADGVLQIETYRGKKGKTRFDYQGKYTWNFQPPPIPMLNGDEYVIMQLEELQNAMGIFEVPSEIAYDRDFVDFHNYNKNTDWVDAVSRDGFINEQFFKLSGGGEKTRYYASVNLHDNAGTTINTSLQRVTTRVNLDYNISQKLRFSVNFSYTNSFKEDNYTFRVYNGVSGVYESTNIREMAYRKAPNMSIYEYDALGRPTGEYFTPIYSYQGIGTQYFNPVAVGNLSSNDIEENRVMNNFTLNYNIRPWVRFQQMVSFQYINQKRNRFLPSDAVGADWLNSMINQSWEQNTTDSEIITRSQLYFSPRINSDHVLSGTVMLETDQLSNEWSTLTGKNGPAADITDPAGNPPINWIASGATETHILGLLASANYVMRDRYIFFANIRTDASSRFGSNNRWGTFPSMGLAWRFSSEPWFKDKRFLSDGKLSYSYGLAGKQPRGAYDRHAVFNTVNPSQYIILPIVVQLQVQLANLKWQTLYSHNLRLDLGLFNDRVSFTGEIYNKITRDLLWNNYEIPKSSGFTQLKWYNGGSVENRGWEMSFFVNPVRTSKVNLNLNFNVSHNTNTFLDFPENFNTERDQNIGNTQFPRRASLGQPIGSFYGVRYLGVWPSDEDVVALNSNGDVLLDINGSPLPFSYKGTYRFQGGDARYEDINHDGRIDIMDVVYLGDSNPDFIGGFGGNFSWNNFRISTQWHYRLGFEIVNEIAMNTEGMLGKDNQSKAVLHRWRAQGQDEPGILPRAYLDHPANNLGSDRYVEKGDFLRLVNLTFSYDVPKEICRKLRINSLDIGVTMRRIVTLTGYSGQDPEIPQQMEDPFWFGTDKATTPPPRAYTLSLGLGF
jgi:TonB-linked SusC/RagA family outer membrane protein